MKAKSTTLPQLPAITAHWIWRPGVPETIWQDTIMARKTFTLPPAATGILRISADSRYRLWVNDVWIGDGPARGWPTHYFYDEHDVTPCLRPGKNEIRIIARHWSAGTFHQRQQPPGLLAQFDWRTPDSKWQTIGTDRKWQTAVANAWLANTPKVSIQMEPMEIFDARLEDEVRWQRAAEVGPADRYQGKPLQPRDVELLTRRPRLPVSVHHTARIQPRQELRLTVNAPWLVHPGLAEANNLTSCGLGLATIIRVKRACDLRLGAEHVLLTVDGTAVTDQPVRLSPGSHLLLAVMDPAKFFGHQIKEPSITIAEPPAGLGLKHPLADPKAETPWVYFVAPPDCSYATEFDGIMGLYPPEVEAAKNAYQHLAAEWQSTLTSPDRLKSIMGEHLQNLPAIHAFVDPFPEFLARQSLGPADSLVARVDAPLFGDGRFVTVRPDPKADVEICYDFGDQTVGYLELQFQAAAGTVVDAFLVENLAPDGTPQHTLHNRNGVRVIAREGTNRFFSLKRRGGRFLFLTLRRATQPVRIDIIRWTESSFPIQPRGFFACDDGNLNRLWQISARTLELCAEDTFTDCPLYEQTLWVGDARNEALYSQGLFEAERLNLRCLKLAAHSLDAHDMVVSQVPSSWNILIPAWSFLWGLAVWEHYAHYGDSSELRRLWPAVKRNLRGAEARLDDRDRFGDTSWNFLDWAPMDAEHAIVTHNQLLMLACVRAAERCAGALAASPRDRAWLRDLRRRLLRGVSTLWNKQEGTFPDSIHADGLASPSISEHNLALALLSDALPAADLARCLEKLLAPPSGMVRAGSPFMTQLIFESLEKAGQPERILSAIRRDYQPMLDSGATTVWESFPTGTLAKGGFPTRSHCHAWSANPLSFFARLILGIKSVAPGCRIIEISPILTADLAWARGAWLTPHGRVRVCWVKLRDGIQVRASAPKAVRLRFRPNPSHEGATVSFRRVSPKAVTAFFESSVVSASPPK